MRMAINTLNEAVQAAGQAEQDDLRGLYPAATRILSMEFLRLRQEIANIWSRMDESSQVADELYKSLERHNPFKR